MDGPHPHGEATRPHRPAINGRTVRRRRRVGQQTQAAPREPHPEPDSCAAGIPRRQSGNRRQVCRANTQETYRSRAERPISRNRSPRPLSPIMASKHAQGRPCLASGPSAVLGRQRQTPQEHTHRAHRRSPEPARKRRRPRHVSPAHRPFPGGNVRLPHGRDSGGHGGPRSGRERDSGHRIAISARTASGTNAGGRMIFPEGIRRRCHSVMFPGGNVPWR